MDSNLWNEAVADIQNYLETSDVGQEDIVLSLTPEFDRDGSIESTDFTAFVRVDMYTDSITHYRVGGSDTRGVEEYGEGVKHLTRAFPDTSITYDWAEPLVSQIDDSIGRTRECIQNFLEAFYLDDDDLSLLVSPVFFDEDRRWAVDHSARAGYDNGQWKYSLDLQEVFDVDLEQFQEIVYPVWIQHIAESFPHAELSFTPPDNIGENVMR